jgi:uncharacterized membrane protein YeaQ/YmgE (transglycosylase-associated protein family)
MINLLVWVLFGALAGWVISLVWSSGSPEVIRRFVLLGIIGALIGGFVTQVLKGDPITTFSDLSIFMAVLGSVILLSALHRFST